MSMIGHTMARLWRHIVGHPVWSGAAAGLIVAAVVAVGALVFGLVDDDSVPTPAPPGNVEGTGSGDNGEPDASATRDAGESSPAACEQLVYEYDKTARVVTVTNCFTTPIPLDSARLEFGGTVFVVPQGVRLSPGSSLLLDPVECTLLVTTSASLAIDESASQSGQCEGAFLPTPVPGLPSTGNPNLLRFIVPLADIEDSVEVEIEF